MHSSATPNAWKMMFVDDMKNTANRLAPLMPSSFSRSETGRSPILSGSGANEVHVRPRGAHEGEDDERRRVVQIKRPRAPRR